MQKINITLDLGKINKDKITTRTFKNREGVDVTAKEYKIEVVPLKEKKIIKKGDGWTLLKTHFVVEAQSKEEKASKTDWVYVGEGMQFENNQSEEPVVRRDEGEVSPDEIPF